MTAPDQTGVLVDALKEQADRLGLTWKLRTATVVNGPDPAVVSVTIDGDTFAIPAVSMIGALAAGGRVFVIDVPPAGTYIIGMVGGTATRTMTNRVYQQATATLTPLTATPQLVVGTQVILSTVGAAAWEVSGIFDFQQTVAGAPTFLGSLVVDSVAQTVQAVFQPAAAAVSRQTTPQQWTGAFTSGGIHTLELRAAVSPVAGTSRANSGTTNIMVKTYE